MSGLPDDWPRVHIQFRCDDCADAEKDRDPLVRGLIYAEIVRPALLAHWTQIAAYLGQKVIDHLKECPNRPPKGNA